MKTSKVFAVACCAVFAGSMLLSACTETPAPKPQPKPEESAYYTVTIADYNKAQGEVSLSAPASEKGYVKDEKVTVTVTPATGFQIGEVKADDAKLEVKDGKAEFTVEEKNVTVSVRFTQKQNDVSSLPEVSGLSESGFGMAYIGTWISTEGDNLLIAKHKMGMNGEGIATVTEVGDGDELSYRFTYDGDECSISWLRNDYTRGFAIKLLNYTKTQESGEDVSKYFYKDPTVASNNVTPISIEEKYFGEWKSPRPSRHTIQIDATSIEYDGVKADVIIDLGYYDTSADAVAAPIGATLYYFFLGNEGHLLSWYAGDNTTGEPMVGNPTVDEVSYLPESDEPYTFEAFFVCTWKSHDDALTIVIDATKLAEEKVTVNGTETEVEGYNQYAFFLVLDGKEYEVGADPRSEYVLDLQHSIYGDDGLISGTEHIYLLKEGRPTVTIGPSAYGEWLSANRFNGVAGQYDGFSISEEGIFWGEDKAEIIAENTEHASGFTYLVYLRGNIYSVSGLEQNGGDAELPADWVYQIVGDEGMYEFVEAVPSSMQGTWKSGNVTITITANEVKWTGYDDIRIAGQGENVLYIYATNSNGVSSYYSFTFADDTLTAAPYLGDPISTFTK